MSLQHYFSQLVRGEKFTFPNRIFNKDVFQRVHMHPQIAQRVKPNKSGQKPKFWFMNDDFGIFCLYEDEIVQRE